MTALEKVEIRRDLIAFTSEQVDLIKNTVARGASDDELKLFLYQCQKTGLDPLAKQIYFRKRRTKNGDVVSIETAIDGYRLIADRTKKYAGNDDPIFDDDANPRKATVSVYKLIGGVRCPFTATARWDQYYPGDTQGFMWRKMPHLMLGKCAEALALRKAFPAELSGVYVAEEMEQVDRDEKKNEAQQSQQAQSPKTIEAEIGPAEGKTVGREASAPAPSTPKSSSTSGARRTQANAPTIVDRNNSGDERLVAAVLRNLGIDAETYGDEILRRMHGKPITAAKEIAEQVVKELAR